MERLAPRPGRDIHCGRPLHTSGVFMKDLHAALSHGFPLRDMLMSMMLCSFSKSAYALLAYCDPRSEWWTSPGWTFRQSSAIRNRRQRQIVLDGSTQRPADDAARISVENHRQENEFLLQPYVGDVGDPQLVHARRRYLPGQIRVDLAAVVGRRWSRRTSACAGKAGCAFPADGMNPFGDSRSSLAEKQFLR